MWVMWGAGARREKSGLAEGGAEGWSFFDICDRAGARRKKSRLAEGGAEGRFVFVGFVRRRGKPQKIGFGRGRRRG